MSGSVKKIFTVLIVVVVMVLLGAFILNIILPNTTATMVNAVEDMIYNATGLGFDFNNDGNMGSSGTSNYQGNEGSSDGVGTGTVEGFN